MALFGKKKQAEPAAPQPTPEDDIQVMSGDASDFDNEDDNEGQTIDFDAIADDLNGDDDIIDLSKSGDAQTDDFAPTADFASSDTGLNADDDLDFNAVFDDGSPADTIPVATPYSDENPFGDGHVSAPAALPDIEPISDAPPLTYTAPLLTSDAVATAGVPASRKSFPLPLMLAAIGLLVALGAVGYYVLGSKSAPEDEPVVATNPALRAPMPDGSGPIRAPGAPANAVNQGIAVDGVPIAPGAVIQTGLTGPRPTVPLTPSLLKQLKDLWKKGANAKNKKDFAGARAAWTKMLQLRPNHPGVREAINKLPAA